MSPSLASSPSPINRVEKVKDKATNEKVKCQGNADLKAKFLDLISMLFYGILKPIEGAS
jgi:hypothetical protein